MMVAHERYEGWQEIDREQDQHDDRGFHLLPPSHSMAPTIHQNLG